MLQDNVREPRKIYELLGMRPLQLTEQKDKISILIGRGRWISQENVRRVEEFTGKKAVVIRKGDEEGLLIALYDSERKFLGIGVLQELDYARRALKILTPVSKEISIVSLGKVKLDKNMKETVAFTEEDSPDFAAFRRLF